MSIVKSPVIKHLIKLFTVKMENSIVEVKSLIFECGGDGRGSSIGASASDPASK